MEQPGFLSRPMSLALDLVRGVAALVVLLGHAVQHDVYTGPWASGDVLQHNAVVVFFVLSGLVIANSAYQRPATLRQFAIARLARIMPVALFAVLFGLLAWGVGQSAPHAIVETAPRFNQPDAASIILPLLFLSEAEWASGPLWNPPYWSLVNEVWYYALFGAALYLRGWQRVAVLALLVPLAGVRVLALLPVWLMGVALARHGPAKALGEGRAMACIMAGLAMFPLTNKLILDVAPVMDTLSAPFTDNLYLARYALTDLALGAGVALAFLGLKTIAEQRAASLEKWQRPITWLAECSFTIYLIHWPILNLMQGWGITAGTNPLLLAGLLALIVAFCGQVAKLTEHRRGDVRRWLSAHWPGQRKAAAQA